MYPCISLDQLLMMRRECPPRDLITNALHAVVVVGSFKGDCNAKPNFTFMTLSWMNFCTCGENCEFSDALNSSWQISAKIRQKCIVKYDVHDYYSWCFVLGRLDGCSNLSSGWSGF